MILRHARADHHAGDLVVEREAVEPEELLEHQRELVRRAFRDGGDPPVVGELAAVEEADDGLGVAESMATSMASHLPWL